MIVGLLRWFLLAAALLLVASLLDGVQVRSYTAALGIAFVLGLLNVFVRPLLILLTLPATVLSLGLFLFVINALVFELADWLLDSFTISSFSQALLGSLMYSLCGLVIDAALPQMLGGANRGRFPPG
jgi:putative membrane protein